MRTATKPAGEPSALITRRPNIRFPSVCPSQSHSRTMKYDHAMSAVAITKTPVSVVPASSKGSSCPMRSQAKNRPATMSDAATTSTSAAKPRFPPPARSYRRTT